MTKKDSNKKSLQFAALFSEKNFKYWTHGMDWIQRFITQFPKWNKDNCQLWFFPRHFAPGCKKTKKRYFWSIFPFFSEAQSAFFPPGKFFPSRTSGRWDWTDVSSFPLLSSSAEWNVNSQGGGRGGGGGGGHFCPLPPSEWNMTNEREKEEKRQKKTKKAHLERLEERGKGLLMMRGSIFNVFEKVFGCLLPRKDFPPFFPPSVSSFPDSFSRKTNPTWGQSWRGHWRRRRRRPKSRQNEKERRRGLKKKVGLSKTSSSPLPLPPPPPPWLSKHFSGDLSGKGREGGKGGGAKSGRRKKCVVGGSKFASSVSV